MYYLHACEGEKKKWIKSSERAIDNFAETRCLLTPDHSGLSIRLASKADSTNS